MVGATRAHISPAEVFAHEQKFKDAADSIRQYLTLKPDAADAADPQSPEANALLGRILFKKGKIAEAVKPLEFAAAKKTADQEARYTLARVYQRLGRREDAAREFAEVERIKSEQLQKDRSRTPKPWRISYAIFHVKYGI